MGNNFQRSGFRFVVSLALTWVLAVTAVAQPSYRQLVDGVAVYLGVVPAQLVRGHPPGHAEPRMHGGAPAGENHVMVALFDDRSGARITNAYVLAKVSGTGTAAIEKPLEPMEIGGATSYGSYFYMAGPGPYRIELRIRLHEADRTIPVAFTWKRE